MNKQAFLDDANVEAVDIDAVHRVLRVRVMRYESPDSSQRISSTLEFRNVQSFSGALNLMELLSVPWEGHLIEWKPSTGFGVSHLYFVRGIFSVHSDEPIVL